MKTKCVEFPNKSKLAVQCHMKILAQGNAHISFELVGQQGLCLLWGGLHLVTKMFSSHYYGEIEGQSNIYNSTKMQLIKQMSSHSQLQHRRQKEWLCALLPSSILLPSPPASIRPHFHKDKCGVHFKNIFILIF